MSQRTIARSYARAFADTLRGDERLGPVDSDLTGFAGAVAEHRKLREFLTGPLVPLAERQQVAEAVLSAGGAGAETIRFAAFLLKRHRMGLVQEIADEFSQLVRDRLGIVDAEVTSAKPLSTEARDKTQQSLARLTGREVRAEFRVDPEILGGLTARVGSTIYDGSVRGRLRRLRERMASE